MSDGQTIDFVGGQPMPADELLRRFDSLDPVTPAELDGLWRGQGVPSGHPLDGVLENLGWFGKRFRADRRADALLFEFDPQRLTPIDPARIPLGLAFRFASRGRTTTARNLFHHLRKLLRARGPTAGLQPREFRGVTTAAMVYDRQPIVDYFRRIDGDRVLGAMSVRDDPRHYFFVLTREAAKYTVPR